VNAHRPVFRLVTAACLLAVSACAGRSRSDSITPSSNVLRITEIQDGIGQGLSSVFELVQRRHPEWLSTVRANPVANNSTPTIFLDLQRMGGIGYLRTIQLVSITGVRYLTPPEARGELGFDNPGGAIIVSTR
jgi:hypothetical protein